MRHLRFDIELPTERSFSATDRLVQEANTRNLRVGYFEQQSVR